MKRNNCLAMYFYANGIFISRIPDPHYGNKLRNDIK